MMVLCYDYGVWFVCCVCRWFGSYIVMNIYMMCVLIVVVVVGSVICRLVISIVFLWFMCVRIVCSVRLIRMNMSVLSMNMIVFYVVFVLICMLVLNI